jgi:hypothetical protein
VTDTFFEPGARVKLPDGLHPPYGVFVNGVRQIAGKDYRQEGRYLLFRETLVREGRLGFWRWFGLFLGVANTYRANDGVDVTCRIKDRPAAFTALPIETLGDPEPGKRMRGAISFDPSGR